MDQRTTRQMMIGSIDVHTSMSLEEKYIRNEVEEHRLSRSHAVHGGSASDQPEECDSPSSSLTIQKCLMRIIRVAHKCTSPLQTMAREWDRYGVSDVTGIVRGQKVRFVGMVVNVDLRGLGIVRNMSESQLFLTFGHDCMPFLF